MGKTGADILYRIPGGSHRAGSRRPREKNNRIVFLSAVRTPFCPAGGRLKEFSPIDLGALAARAAIEQAGLTGRTHLIDAAIFGNGMHTSIDTTAPAM
jgi:acetyl-CoA acetyltransferase